MVIFWVRELLFNTKHELYYCILCIILTYSSNNLQFQNVIRIRIWNRALQWLRIIFEDPNIKFKISLTPKRNYVRSEGSLPNYQIRAFDICRIRKVNSLARIRLRIRIKIYH